MPPPLDQIGQRPFSFYPAILGIEHNEWLLRRATWSELLVYNTKTEQELWVPRRFLGEISSIDEPVMIVGLLKELEYKAGTVWPHERRVIEMPRAVNESPRPPVPSEPPHPASVVGIRLEGGAESPVGRLLLTAIAVGIVACIVVVIMMRDGPLGTRISYQGVLQSDLPLNAHDDYYSVVNKLGKPAAEGWKSETGELQYEKLWYPQLGVSVILMGTDRKTAHYVGAMDKNWRVVQSVDLAAGQNSSSILKQLKQF